MGKFGLLMTGLVGCVAIGAFGAAFQIPTVITSVLGAFLGGVTFVAVFSGGQK